MYTCIEKDEQVESGSDDDAHAEEQREKLERKRLQRVTKLIEKKKAEGAKPIKKAKKKDLVGGKPKKTIKKTKKGRTPM